MIKNKTTHVAEMKRLEARLKLAEEKKEERELRWEIRKAAMPFKFQIKFSKFIVVFCIMAILGYTIAAIALQMSIAMEISPTLTTCVYAFFGTELLGMVGIKVADAKYTTKEPPTQSMNLDTEFSDVEIIDDEAVG